MLPANVAINWSNIADQNIDCLFVHEHFYDSDHVQRVILNQNAPYLKISRNEIPSDYTSSDTLYLPIQADDFFQNWIIINILPKLNETSVEDSSDRNSGFGVSAMFDQGTGFTAGLAYDKDVNITGDIIRGSATVDLGKYMAAPVTLGALYQVADYDATSEDEKGLLVSAALGLSNFAKPASIYAQYNNTSDRGGVENADADQIVVGGRYFYKENMIAHAYVGANTIEVPNLADQDAFAIGGGLEYKF